MEKLMKSSEPSKLFVYTAVDARDEFEEKYERAFQHLQQITVGLSDKDLHDLLSGLVGKDKHHEEISIGLIYQILTDPNQAPKAYRDLTLLTRDGLVFVTTNMSILIAEKYQKLSETARRQSFWVVRELVKNQVPNVDNIVWNMLRQASGGDVSSRNLQLVESLLDILIEHRQWLEKNSFLVGAVIYTYVRLIEDHHGLPLTNLRAKEVKFIISLIRERFVDVLQLGRDFVRLLQNVARIPEFDQLWRDILFNPKSLLAGFTGIWHLLQTRTSRRFLQCRLTPDVERKMHFFTNNVKFGTQKRYQDWFQDKYFGTPESHSLRSDLIRFIINAIHPTNDMLCSDLIPRWAIIGWLLTTCTNTTALANAKMALFYDWLFFDPAKDNIMNVEPGILVMFHSIRHHPLVSSTLLDFLCRTMKNFFPKNEDRIRMGVYNSMRKILEKQVIPNLNPLFESPKLDRELRATVRDNFREFCGGIEMNHMPVDAAALSMHQQLHQQQQLQQQQQQQQQQQHMQHPQLYPPHLMDDTRMQMNPVIGHAMQQQQQHPHPIGSDATLATVLHATHPPFMRSESSDGEPDVKFSDDEEPTTEANEAATTTTTTTAAAVKCEETDDDDDLPLSKVRLKEKPVPDKVELPAAIAASFDKFVAAKTSPALDALLTDLRTCAALDDEQETYVVDNVIDIIKSTLPDSPFPDSKTDEKALATSIGYPLFSLFKVMFQYEEKLKKTLQTVLRAVFSRTESTYGHRLLYFLKVNAKLMARKAAGSGTATAAAITFKTSVYRMLCEFMEESIESCLARDLAELEAESASMFLWVLPDVFREFKGNMLNNSAVLRVLVGCVDARGLRDLIYSVTQGKLTLFKNDGVLQCVRDSLGYETFEQYCLWQLVQAHDVPIEYLQDLLPDLESSNHAEALTYMLLMLKNEKPTNELTRLLLSRETKSRGDQFVTSALRYWCQDFEENLSEIIATLLTSKYPHTSPNKRKRPLKGNATQNSSPTSDQLLSHLEHFRRSCRHGNGTGTGLYVQDAMQRALQQAFLHSSENTKKQYSDLFALAAEDDTSGVGRRGTSGRGRKPPANKKDSNSATGNNKKNTEPINNVYSSDAESSEEDWTKLKTPKRRKKAISDSD